MSAKGVKQATRARASNLQDRRFFSAENRFEELVSELSTTIAAAPPQRLDEELDRAFERIGQTLEIDRCGIVQLDADSGSFLIRHQWTSDDRFRVSEDFDFLRTPWWLSKMMSGEGLVYSAVAELPAETAQDAAYLGEQLAQSSLGVPLTVGGRFVGFATFGSIRRARVWSSKIVSLTRLITRTMGDAIARKQSALEIARLRAELIRVSRVLTMGELAAAMAHELNQPLTAIVANAEAINDMLDDPEIDSDEVKAVLSDIVADGVRAGETVRRVKALVKGAETSKAPIVLDEVLGELARILRSDAIIRDVKLTIKSAAELPSVLADRIQLQQAVINLVMNGIDSVAERNGTLRAVSVLAAAPEEGWVQLEVQDTGGGIPADVKDRLFAPFFTTKREGTGMGLAITKSIVEAHGGRLAVSSNEHGGATFTIKLPAA